MQLTISFLYNYIFAIINGLFWGFMSALFFKLMIPVKISRVQEIFSIFFFALISYLTANFMEQSAGISMLFTAFAMSHYTFYNMSFQAKEESAIVSKLTAIAAEAFTYTYLGLTFLNLTRGHISFSFIFWQLLLILVVRTIVIGLIFQIIKLIL